MKKIIEGLLLCLLFAGCDDFFETNTDDVYNADDYMGSSKEIFAGYLGLITRLQEVGDQAIFLTDLRAHCLEPTENAPQDLLYVYNYDDLQDNPYADPRGYYNLIIACNDYLKKAFEFNDKNPGAVDDTQFKQLIGGALRFKTWSYLMLAKIYGEAVYFDDPMVKYEDLSDKSKFQLLSLDALLDKCNELMTVGVNGIDASGVLDWQTVISMSQSTGYMDYNLATPNYDALMGEIAVWRKDWQTAYDHLLYALNNGLSNGSNTWQLGNWHQGSGRRQETFGNQVSGLSKYLVSAITYDSDNGQTNRIFEYFEDIYPCKYYLRPSEYMEELYSAQMRPGDMPGEPSGDPNREPLAYKQSGDHYKVALFYNSSARTIYENDVHINIYRMHDLYYMLIEAMNHLGNWKGAEILINSGLENYDNAGNYLTDETSVFFGFNKYWVEGYGNLGLRGFSALVPLDLPEGVTDKETGKPLVESIVDEERAKAYDLALLDEALLEFPYEGKVYPMLIKMALRYNDLSIIADRICPKYPESIRETVRAKIMSGGYFVKWDLRTGE